jgi:hypothetical protein
MSCKSLRNSKVQFEVGREISEGIQLEASICFRHLVENLYILRDKIIWKELAENEIQKTEAVNRLVIQITSQKVNQQAGTLSLVFTATSLFKSLTHNSSSHLRSLSSAKVNYFLP